MNNPRRRQIGLLIAELDGIVLRIEELRDAEQEAADNIPESMAERIEAAEAAIEALEAATEAIDEAVEQLHDAMA